jgi:hypothetical protein
MCALGAPARTPAETGAFADAPGMRRRGIAPTTDLPSASTKASLRFHYALVFGGTETRAHVRLLGPCFKTGRMEPQPNSSQTPARTAEPSAGKSPTPKAHDREPGGLKPHRALQRRCPRLGSPGEPGPVRARYNCRGANNGSPEGLETERAHKNASRPNLPTASAREPTRCKQTGKHNPRAARMPLTHSRQVATSY